MFIVYSAEEDTLSVYREAVGLAGNWSNMCLVLGLLPSDQSAIEAQVFTRALWYKLTLEF